MCVEGLQEGFYITLAFFVRKLSTIIGALQKQDKQDRQDKNPLKALLTNQSNQSARPIRFKTETRLHFPRFPRARVIFLKQISGGRGGVWFGSEINLVPVLATLARITAL